MKFLAFFAAAAGLASAADLCMTTNANCGGGQTCCKGITAGKCCDFNGFTNTQLLYKLPANRYACLLSSSLQTQLEHFAKLR